jgi:hypothetical protein
MQQQAIYSHKRQHILYMEMEQQQQQQNNMRNWHLAGYCIRYSLLVVWIMCV